MLNVIQVLIHLLLGFWKKRLCLILFSNLKLGWCNLWCSLGVHFKHFGFSCFSFGSCSIFLFFHQFFLLLKLFFCFNRRGFSYSLHVFCRNDDRISLIIFLSFSSNCAQFFQGNNVCCCFGCSCWWFGSKESFINCRLFTWSLACSWSDLRLDLNKKSQ